MNLTNLAPYNWKINQQALLHVLSGEGPGWILASGFWDDDNFWRDDEAWID